MKLLLWAHGRYQVFAACSDRGDCHLLSFLNQLEGDFQDQADRMTDLLDRVAEKGPPRKSEVCHQIQDNIWQLESGRLRVLWFYGRDRGVIICSHGFLKTTQKTPKKHINRAMQTYHRYCQDVSRGDIKILEIEDED